MDYILHLHRQTFSRILLGKVLGSQLLLSRATRTVLVTPSSTGIVGILPDQKVDGSTVLR